MKLEELNPKNRLNNLAENYAKYRPNYPKIILEFLNEAIGLTKEHIIADIGSGTGLSAKLFLDNENKVFGVEPNKEMRAEGEKYLSDYKKFHSINGSAEDTKLESESVDVIISGQTFDFLDSESTKKEFLRILKPGGYVVIFNNIRKVTNGQFMSEYMKLAEKYYEKDFTSSIYDISLPEFFDHKTIHNKVFSNLQRFTLERLEGELLSYSFMPNKDDPRYNAMISEFEDLFKRYTNNETIIFEYETVLNYCKMK